MPKYILTISLLLISCLTHAQDDQKLKDHFEEDSFHMLEYRGLELGFNITTVLSRFVGNSPGTDDLDFPFLFRIHGEKSALRIGVGASFNRSSFFDATTITTRETEERNGVLKIGFERNVNIKKRLSFYWGLEAFGGIEYESVVTSNFTNSLIAKDILRLGGGPFLGFSYSINHKVRLHTETNILGFYEKTTTTEVIGGEEEPIAETDGIGGRITPPIALYVNLKF